MHWTVPHDIGPHEAESVGGPKGLRRLQNGQIIRGRLSNRRERNAGVERDEPCFILNGKGEKINVGKLSWAVNSGRVNNVRI